MTIMLVEIWSYFCTMDIRRALPETVSGVQISPAVA
jgi:hypothetical protein